MYGINFIEKRTKGRLNKTNRGLSKVLVGLGWDTNRYDGQNDFDLDVSIFLVGANGKVSGAEDFVFYNNPKGANGAVEHLGDNRTGEGEGDDESIKVDLKMYLHISNVFVSLSQFTMEKVVAKTSDKFLTLSYVF